MHLKRNKPNHCVNGEKLFLKNTSIKYLKNDTFICYESTYYELKSKILQYFCNVWHNSIAPYAFVETLKDPTTLGCDLEIA